MSSDEISQILQSFQQISSPSKLRLAATFANQSISFAPSSNHFTMAAAHGHWETLILIHSKYPASITSQTMLETSENMLSEPTTPSPSKRLRTREKKKICSYLQHAKKQKMNPTNEPISDEIYEMLLLTSWRFGDVEWTEDLLDEVEMDSDSVFSLLKESLVAGDDIFVSDLISRGANLEKEVPKRGSGALNEEDLCWETVLHHCATSLPLQSNGSTGPLVRLIVGTGRAFLDRRDENGHTPLSLAVVEGNMAMVRILVNEYKTDLDFDVCSLGIPFRQWAVDSKAEGRVRPGFTYESMQSEIEEVSLVLSALLSMREDVTKETSGGGETTTGVYADSGSGGHKEELKEETKSEVK